MLCALAKLLPAEIIRGKAGLLHHPACVVVCSEACYSNQSHCTTLVITDALVELPLVGPSSSDDGGQPTNGLTRPVPLLSSASVD